jgi:hypothetical protein
MTKKFLGPLVIFACLAAATLEEGIAETLTPRQPLSVGRPGTIAPIPPTRITKPNTTGGSPNGRVEGSWTPRNYSSGSDLSGGVTGSNVSNAKIEKHRP